MDTKQNHSIGIIPITASKLLERMGYYGIRSILFLYLVNGPFALSKAEAASFYGNFTLAISILPLLGGLLGDLLIGARLASVIGVGLQTMGCFLLATPIYPGFIFGVILIALGIGLYNPNIISSLGLLYNNRKNKLDSAMYIFYIGINVGAFAAPIVIAGIAYKFGYNVGFILAGIIQLGSMLILIFTRKTLAEVPFKANIYLNETNKNQMNIGLRIVSIILIFIAVPMFWIAFELPTIKIYEMYVSIENNLGYNNFSIYAPSFNSLTIIIASIALSIIFSFTAVSSKLKIGIGFIIASLLLFIISTASNNEANSSLVFLVIFISIFQVIAELFVSPIALSFIAKNGFIKFNATLISLSMVITGIVSNLFFRFFSALDNNAPIFYIIGGSVMLLFSALFFVLYFINKSTTSNNTDIKQL